MPSPLIAAGRLTIASLILFPMVMRRYRYQLNRLTRFDLLFVSGAGAFLAAHFILLFFAVEQTTVLVAQTVVNSAPLWVAILETAFLKARLPRMVWIGIFIAMAGGVILSVGGASNDATAATHSNTLVGASLALISAFASASYLTIGRKVRAHVSAIPYVWMVYCVAALVAWTFIGLTRVPVTGHTTLGWFWILLIGLGPQLVGHSLLNFAMGYLPATLVSISGQVISVTAAVIAFFLFTELPSFVEVVASVVIISGVTAAIIGQRRKSGR